MQESNQSTRKWIGPIQEENTRRTSHIGLDVHNERMIWNNPPPKYIINDNIYGTVSVPSPINKILDTMEFQRLRKLKQTGLVNLVYPNCDHSRFVHSLGTFSLAHKLVGALRTNQPSLEITSAEHLCVSVAALLHDVGHGPFSHLFDGEFAKRSGSTFKHEDMSIRIIKRIMQQADIKEAFEPFLGMGDQYNQKVQLITELIRARPFDFQDTDNFKSLTDEEREKAAKKEWSTLIFGCGPEKSFLFDIVSNSYSGHDVDKMDYLLRDSKASGVSISFGESALNRLLTYVRVVVDPNSRLKRIAYSHKCMADIKTIGDSRQELHGKVYQHKTVRSIEIPMVDALEKAGDLLLYKGSNGEMFPLNRVTEDVEAFLQTSDFVEQEILNSQSTDPRMIEAKSCLHKIQRRQIGYKLGYFEMCPKNAAQSGAINNETGPSEVGKKLELKMREILEEMDEEGGFEGRLKNLNFSVMHSVLGRGLDEYTHPIERQLFYYGKITENGDDEITGFYPSEDYIINNAPSMPTKWEFFVMGDYSLRDAQSNVLIEPIKRALLRAAESEKFLSPKKTSPSNLTSAMRSTNCPSITAKRRLDFVKS